MQNIKENGVPAGFFPRVAAYLIDLLLVGFVLGMVKVPFVVISWFVSNIFWSKPILFYFSLLDIIFYGLGVLYFIIFTYYSGSTLGKKAMRIQVVSSREGKLTLLQVVYRETIGRFLSGFIMEIGYLMVLVDNKKEGLHDKLADTRVVYTKMVQEEQKLYVNEEDKHEAETNASLQETYETVMNVQELYENNMDVQEIYENNESIQEMYEYNEDNEKDEIM